MTPRTRSVFTLALALAAIAHARAQESRALFDAAVVEIDALHRYDCLADLDGDGRMDAIGIWPDVSANHQARITAWINDGSRLVEAWTITQPCPTFPTPVAIAVGDVDGDARTDFAAIVERRVCVYTSNGAAPPALRTNFVETAYVHDVVLADFDGNGTGDLALLGDTDFRIWLDQGAGVPPLLKHAAFLGGAKLSMLHRAELNGDGRPDVMFMVDDVLVLAPIFNGNTIGVQGFVPGVKMPMPAAGDVDGDGDEDVVVFGAMPDEYVVLRRTGPATFVQEPAVTGGPATELCDVDLDGDLDGICCSSGGGADPPQNLVSSKFEVTLNDGAGGFAPAFTIPGLGSQHIAGGTDLDSDGDVDLVAGRCVYYPRGPIHAPKASTATGSQATTRTIGDLDGDGDLDQQVQKTFEAAAGSYLRNRGDGTFETFAPAMPPPPLGAWQGQGYPIDVDGDGDLDRMMRTVGGPSSAMVLMENTGGGEYVAGPEASTAPIGFYYEPDHALCGDVDGDGDGDLVADGVLWTNDGAGHFASGGNLFIGQAKELADLDGDGRPDVIGQTGYRLAQPDGSLGPVIAFPHSAVINGIHALADLDGDGDLDLADVDYAQDDQPTVVLVNDGAGHFAATYPFQAPDEIDNNGAVFRKIVAIDVDGDGRKDLVRYPAYFTGTAGSIVNLRKHDGSGWEPGIVQALQASAGGDLDGDGDDDLLQFAMIENRRLMPPQCGERRQYGAPSAGTGGMRSQLGAVGPFRAGERAELRLRGATGATAGVVFVGLTESNLVNKPKPGLALYAFPIALVVAVPVGGNASPGSGSFTFPYVVPASAVGFHFFHQFFVADPGAPSGATCTNGLDLYYGP